MERPKLEYSLEYFSQAEEWCWKAFKLYQKAQDDTDILHDSAKDLLAGIMSNLDKPEEKISESKLERLARDSQEWRTFQVGKHAAIQKAGEGKVKYCSALRLWETIQSGLSFRKEEF